MDYKKIKTENTAVTRRVRDFDAKTGNIYETVSILSKRANQISLEIKEEIDSKIADITTPSDSLEQVFENREQIEVAIVYERRAYFPVNGRVIPKKLWFWR